VLLSDGYLIEYSEVSELQIEWNISVNIEVIQRYWVMDLLQFTVMCFWHTGWGKYSYVQRSVPEEDGKWKIYVCSDMCLRNRVREKILCSLMCVRSTGLGKWNCEQWCFLRYMLSGIIIFTEMCVRITGWGKF